MEAGIASGVLAWWAVPCSCAAVLGWAVGEPVHTSRAGDRIAQALAAGELAVLASAPLSVEVLVGETLLGSEIALVVVLGESEWAGADASIWRHQLPALRVAANSEVLGPRRADPKAVAILLIGAGRAGLHAQILIEHQAVWAAAGGNALEVRGFKAFVADEADARTQAEVAVAGARLTDSVGGVGIEPDVTDELASPSLEEEGGRAPDAGVVDHAGLVFSIDFVALRAELKIAGGIGIVVPWRTDDGARPEEVPVPPQGARLDQLAAETHLVELEASRAAGALEDGINASSTGGIAFAAKAADFGEAIGALGHTLVEVEDTEVADADAVDGLRTLRADAHAHHPVP